MILKLEPSIKPNRKHLFMMYKNIWQEWLDSNLDWDEKWQRLHFLETFNFDNLFFIKKDSRKIGYLQMVFNKPILYIEKFEILKEFQHKGYGNRIIKFLRTEYYNQPVTIQLFVLLENLDAFTFYTKCGFEIIREDKYYYKMQLK